MSPTSLADRYHRFAEQQAAGSSPSFERWARHVAQDDGLLARLGTLTPAKQQPNLVFAAARLHGACPGDVDSLRDTLELRWDAVRSTILARMTQTNEAARCAAVLLGLARLAGPVALIEVGAAAGLCLVPDRYSYSFSDGTRLDPAGGPSTLTIPITLCGAIEMPTRMPQIVWRAGLDLNPLDAADPDDVEWLRALVWPEHDARRRRLDAAATITADAHVNIRRGDLLTQLPGLVDAAPAGASVVVTNIATFAYLEDSQRRKANAVIGSSGAHHLSIEGRGVDPQVNVDAPVSPQTLFVAALDGEPYALMSGHGDRITELPPTRSGAGGNCSPTPPA